MLCEKQQQTHYIAEDALNLLALLSVLLEGQGYRCTTMLCYVMLGWDVGLPVELCKSSTN